MADPATIVSYTASLCWSIWRLLKAIGNFNYHLVSTVLRVGKEAWFAFSAFAVALGSASCDIVSYFYEFLLEFGYFLAVLCHLANQLIILVARLLSCLYGLLMQLVAVVGNYLFFILKWVWANASSGFDALATSTRGLQQIAKRQLFASFETVASTSCDVINHVHTFSVRILHWASASSLSIGRWLKSIVVNGCDTVAEITQGITDKLLCFGSSLWDSFIQHISLHDVCLTLGLTIVVVSLLRVLVVTFRKYGLTVPFLGHHAMIRHHITHRSHSSQRNIVDDFIIISDEEEEENEEHTLEDVDWNEEDSLQTETSIGSLTDSFTEEFEVIDDDDDVSDLEAGDENDQNVINIQLSRECTGYGLREHVSHSPSHSFSKLSPNELARYLENERDQRLCVVCQDNQKNVLILPCKHMCMCVRCAHQIATTPNHNRRICPLCRCRINTVMDVFV